MTDPTETFRITDRCADILNEDGSSFRCGKFASHAGPHELGEWEWWTSEKEPIMQTESEALTWTPEVERLRKAMMERFSDKLTMEEIAEFAYFMGREK